MARIIYGVMGDSGGHISRALAVARELPQHEFLFVGGGTVVTALDHGYRFLSLPMLSTILKDNKVLATDTVANFFHVIFRYRGIVDRLCRSIDAFKPDLAVTDYEFFLPRAARIAGVKCVSLDHQHVLTHCESPIPPGERWSRFVTTNLIRHFFSAADSYLVSSLENLVAKKANTEIVPPIMHRDVLELKASCGDHVVVYMRSGVDKHLMQGLLSTNRECHIYGTGERGKRHNLSFMPPSRSGFLEDLSSCAYVICNGGYALTGEALQLGKPVLAFPTAFFYEQCFNAHHLKLLGYGDHGQTLQDSVSVIRQFEKVLPFYVGNLKDVDLFGNEIAAQKLISHVGSY
nr:glycosyltransferase family protein [Pseudodesulfovibrio sp.]